MKKGVLKITDVLYKNHWLVVSQLFKDFRPLHIEFRHWENDLWYLYGESEKFEEVKEGEMFPVYSVEVTSYPNDTYSFEFQRVPDYSSNTEPVFYSYGNGKSLYIHKLDDKKNIRLCDGCNVRGNWEHRCHGDNCDCDNPICMEKQGKITYDELMEIVSKAQNGSI